MEYKDLKVYGWKVLMSCGFMKVYFHLSWKMKFPGFVFHLISRAVFISIYEFVWMSF